MTDAAKEDFPIEHESLLESISLIHFLYKKYENYFEWFDQLVSHVPSILIKLDDLEGLDIKVQLYTIHNSVVISSSHLKLIFTGSYTEGS